MQITNSIEHSPWKANCHSASQIPHLLWNPKVHYCVNMIPPLVPILRQTNPVHNFPYYIPKIHSSIILSSMPRSSEWSLSSGFSDKNFVSISHLSHTCYIAHASHPLDLITLIISGEAWKLWSFSLFSLLQPLTVFSFLGYSPQHSVLKHPQSMFFPYNERTANY